MENIFCSCSDNKPAVQGTWLQQTIHSSLRGNCMHGWRVILRLHTVMSRKSERRERGILVSWFAGGASITWEWIGVMTLFLSSSWLHLYIAFCGGRAIHLSEPPQVDKGTNRQIETTLSSVLLTLWCVLYVSGFLIVSEEIRDWFWIIQGSGSHCQPGYGWCWILQKQYCDIWRKTTKVLL